MYQYKTSNYFTINFFVFLNIPNKKIENLLSFKIINNTFYDIYVSV